MLEKDRKITCCVLVMVMARFSLAFAPHSLMGHCKNRMDEIEDKLKVGLLPSIEPRNRIYNPSDHIKFSCPDDYLLEVHGKRSKYLWYKCTVFGVWNREQWPVCRGPYENVTCHNEYLFTRQSEKSWLNPTPNFKHALYKPPNQKIFKHLTVINFQCPSGMNFRGTKGLVIMQSKCGSNGDWTREWPMCQGNTCSPYRLIHGTSGTEDRLFSPGTSVQIKCHTPHFHLWGTNTSTCANSLTWSGSTERDCITMSRFRSRCVKKGRMFETRHNNIHGYLEPVCHARRVSHYEEMRREEAEGTRRIILASAVPLSVLFFIFLTISSVYVYRLRRRNRMLSYAIRYQNEDNVIQMFLPSYEDALKSKPTTPPPSFDESCSLLPPNERTFSLSSSSSHHHENESSSPRASSSLRAPSSPPPYVVDDNQEEDNEEEE